MKIVDFVRSQCRCGKCIHGASQQRIPSGWAIDCASTDKTPWSEDIRTCGAWYLELTFQPDTVMKLDREHKVIHVYDFPSWVNLYQAPRVPQIRVLSREEWPEVQNG